MSCMTRTLGPDVGALALIVSAVDAPEHISAAVL